MIWVLRDENNIVWTEVHKEQSFDDISELVGMNIHQIIYMEMRLLNGKADCDHQDCKRKKL